MIHRTGRRFIRKKCYCKALEKLAPPLLCVEEYFRVELDFRGGANSFMHHYNLVAIATHAARDGMCCETLNTGLSFAGFRLN